MNASACAPSPATRWNSMDWVKAEAAVKRLQMRIAKATREGRWGKVKALQWLLTHSFFGKCLAVKRVTANRGKRTPGVDKVTWPSASAKGRAVGLLKTRGYKAQSLRRVYIPKANGKQRPLGIPTMKDRAMQALYRLSLEPVAETTADHDSYGFRSKRCTADAIQACFDRLCRKGSMKWIFEADIKGCFDNILHSWLLTHIPLEQRVLRQWLNAGYIEKGQLFSTQAGTPQGGIISPMLANMALDGLQKRIESLALRPDKRPWFKIVRYADDFIITGPSKEGLEQEVLPVVQAFLEERGLALAPNKTRLTHIDEGFDFLGQNVRKYQDKLIIKPAKKNLRAFLGNIRQTVKTLRQAKAEKMINALNPKILGWCNYHRYIVAKKAFSHVDEAIYRTLWRWAKRRHPMKNGWWLHHKYFKSVQKRHWVFSADVVDKSGRKQVIHLRKAMDVKIRRYLKIRRDAHPFAPEFRQYFKRRDQQPTSRRDRLLTKKGLRKA